MSNGVSARSRVLSPAVLGALLFSVAALALALMRGGTALVVSRPVPDPDAIVSLASHEWERLPEAADLAARFPRATLVLTLPQHVTKYNCHDCANRIHRLQRAGVVKERIRVVQLQEGGTSRRGAGCSTLRGRTRTEASAGGHVPLPHAALSRDLCYRPGGGWVQVGVAPATTSSHANPAWWWLLPDDRAYVPYEWAAIVYYAVFHGVRPA